jgi:hypothetical protein
LALLFDVPHATERNTPLAEWSGKTLLAASVLVGIGVAIWEIVAVIVAIYKLSH